jgi:ATP-binding cassette subfamily B (MDR/TAP) protein 1
VAEALILGTMMVGQATAFAPNYNKAVIAAARVFKLLDRVPLIDGDGQSGVRLVSDTHLIPKDKLGFKIVMLLFLNQNRIEGDISFKDADFSYPTRPQVNVLKSLSLSLTPGTDS